MFFSKKQKALTEALPTAPADLPINIAPAERPASPSASPIVASASAPTAPEASLPAAGERRGADTHLRHRLSRDMSAVYGSITRVFAATPTYQSLPLAELRWLVVPATVTGQYAIGEGALDASRAESPLGPVAVVTWARVSAEIDRHLTQNPEAPLRLSIEQWQSGDVPWILDVAGNKAIVDRIIGELLAKQFKGRSLKIRMRADDGRITIGEYAAAAAA
jgi:hemolysin-activating ACP:hemolysin acyltransferase